MPAPTPEQSIDDLIISVSIKVNGSVINDTYGVISINVVHEINRISFCEIVLVGDTVESHDHPITDGTDFDPGSDITVSVGYGSADEATIFTGVIARHAVEINSSSSFNVRINCKHKAIGMTFNKTESEFKDQTDSAVITSIIGNYSGLSATVDASSHQQENIFQKLGTDWDFILARAEFLGYIITLDGDGVFVGKPKLSTSPVLRIAYGESIISFSGELSAEKQAPSIVASAWDIKTQALIKETAAEPSMNTQGSVSAATMSASLSQAKLNLISSTPMVSEELKSWADGNLLRMRLSAIKGNVKFIGSALVTTGSIIQLEGVGKKFNGNAFVSAVNHEISQGNWTTKVKFGLDAKYIHEKENFAYPNASGQLPPVHGFHVATVKQVNEDPQSQYRVLVDIPSSSETQSGFWARLSGFYATSGAGAFFYPEVGDEVIVGFIENDPRYPIIIGSVYGDNLKAPLEPTATNYIKSIITKAQLKISFDDEKKILTIVTPAGNTVTLDDDGKSVEIKDQNSNKIKMDSSGITISSDKDVNINAQNINLSAKAKVAIAAQADATVEGLNVSLTAKMGFTAKGTSTAEVSASGQTTIKGAMVMIN